MHRAHLGITVFFDRSAIQRDHHDVVLSQSISPVTSFSREDPSLSPLAFLCMRREDRLPGCCCPQVQVIGAFTPEGVKTSAPSFTGGNERMNVIAPSAPKETEETVRGFLGTARPATPEGDLGKET